MISVTEVYHIISLKQRSFNTTRFTIVQDLLLLQFETDEIFFPHATQFRNGRTMHILTKIPLDIMLSRIVRSFRMGENKVEPVRKNSEVVTYFVY